LRRVQGSADDSGVVAQMGRDDRRPQLDMGQQFIGDVADSAADDDQLRPLKMLKRRTYRRTAFPLLRKRVLLAG